MTAAVTSKTLSDVALLDSEMVNRWIAFAQVSEASEKSYRKGIRRLSEYCTGKNIREFSRKMFVDYREFLIAKYSGSTVNLYLTAAKLFCTFLQVEGILGGNPTEHLKGVKIADGHKKDALSVEDTKKILATFDTSTLKGKRDKAMYSLMTTAGLRTVEISHTKVGDIHFFGGKYFLRIQGKGHSEKDAQVRISDGVFALIEEYLSARENPPTDSALFASVARRNYGKPMTATSISRIVKDALKVAGYNSRRLTAHSLRHTAATVALLAGATLREVQQVLRHRNITVTQIYLHELDRLKNRAECLVSSAFGI